jgi:hypothetical protein
MQRNTLVHEVVRDAVGVKQKTQITHGELGRRRQVRDARGRHLRKRAVAQFAVGADHKAQREQERILGAIGRLGQ